MDKLWTLIFLLAFPAFWLLSDVVQSLLDERKQKLKEGRTKISRRASTLETAEAIKRIPHLAKMTDLQAVAIADLLRTEWDRRQRGDRIFAAILAILSIGAGAALQATIFGDG